MDWLRIIFTAPKLVMFFLTLPIHLRNLKNRAVRQFKKTLQDKGLPEDVILALTKAYDNAMTWFVSLLENMPALLK
jgi:hypothetical protein